MSVHVLCCVCVLFVFVFVRLLCFLCFVSLLLNVNYVYTCVHCSDFELCRVCMRARV